jgi:hypothetical protein
MANTLAVWEFLFIAPRARYFVLGRSFADWVLCQLAGLPGGPISPLPARLAACYRRGMDEEIPTPDELWLAQEKAVQLGLLERASDGTLTITDKGEEYFFEWVSSQPTLH